MDRFIISCTFLMIFYIAILVLTFVIKSVPALIRRPDLRYHDMLKEIKDNFEIKPLTKDEVKEVKSKVNFSPFTLAMLAVVDVLAIGMFITFLNEPEVNLICKIIYVVVFVIINAVVLIWLRMKANAYKMVGDFNKRPAMLLDYKAKTYYKGYDKNGRKKPRTYTATIGTYCDHGKPYVVKVTLTKHLFNKIQDRGRWSIVFYHGRAITVFGH